MAKSCQFLLQEAAGSVRRVPLAGADIRLVDEAIILPYQEGNMLYDTNTSIEIISNSNGAVTDAEATHAQEVFMIR
jgi:hypothetical protein